ncbi:MAG: M1 family metallopeptidase [Actinobacteria bacterium]|nr:M1 family metallopeptidase [Actinomycetota bacterium]
MKFMVNRRARRAGIAALAAVAIGLSVPATATSAFAADPVDGAPSIGDSLFPGIGNGGYDVDHYDVNLSFAFPNTITAVTTITATAQSPLKSFSLDFEGLTVSSVKVNGVAAQYTRTADLPNSAHKLRIRPSKTLPAGKFTVEVAYAGTPSTHTDPDGSQEGWVQTPDGATALGQPVGTMAWIPSNNTPADKATYRFSYTIPTQLDGVDLAAAGNGELISKTPSEDGTTTWIWDQRQQMSTMATFVSIGKYLTYDSEITLSSGKTIKEWSFVDPTVTANNQATIQTRRGQLKTMLDFLESKYGPYPGNSTGIVVDITSLGYALETQDRPYFERSVSESTLIHELAHQWFGDGISPRDWNHIWLSEGMATFAEAMWTEQKGGTNAVTAQYNRWNSTAVTSSLWTPAPAHMTSGAQLFNSPVYTRGAMAWGALKEALGAEKFGNLIKEQFLDNRDWPLGSTLALLLTLAVLALAALAAWAGRTRRRAA